MDDIISLISATASPNDQYRIGVWDVDDGTAGNIDGTDFDYENFASGMPVANNGDKCVAIDGASGEWIDVSCTDNYKSICGVWGIPSSLTA